MIGSEQNEFNKQVEMLDFLHLPEDEDKRYSLSDSFLGESERENDRWKNATRKIENPKCQGKKQISTKKTEERAG